MHPNLDSLNRIPFKWHFIADYPFKFSDEFRLVGYEFGCYISFFCFGVKLLKCAIFSLFTNQRYSRNFSVVFFDFDWPINYIDCDSIQFIWSATLQCLWARIAFVQLPSAISSMIFDPNNNKSAFASLCSISCHTFLFLHIV